MVARKRESDSALTKTQARALEYAVGGMPAERAARFLGVSVSEHAEILAAALSRTKTSLPAPKRRRGDLRGMIMGILRFSGAPMTVAEIAARCETDSGIARRLLKAAHRDGEVEYLPTNKKGQAGAWRAL